MHAFLMISAPPSSLGYAWFAFLCRTAIHKLFVGSFLAPLPHTLAGEAEEPRLRRRRLSLVKGRGRGGDMKEDFQGLVI